ncbi:glycoside hydrolase family 9 protein [Flavihumibacter sp. ZG627]|uniref:glycoside hydrolase family 9 protein n=1 Tax=Flavihumibacter sp. ZG627 TaxID=1463156 RepID=UPI00057D83D9|nr:glycoside hydrolase family 9 protein [Flavihumibacter sp. ZG627]KIC91383.1 cellulase [Flavihumibacter sp. ZG627]
MNSKHFLYFLVLLFVFVFSINAQDSNITIQVNQIGYYPNAIKIAVLQFNDKHQINGNDFYLVNQADGDTVFKGKLGSPVASVYSNAITQQLNFSAFRIPGTYALHIPDKANSYPFAISNEVHAPLLQAALKGFYYQRSDIPIEKQYGGKWARSAGHPDTSVQIHASAASKLRPTGTIVSSPGGWYDAGDYNKYIVNSGITMGTLLSLYEDFPEHFNKLKFSIPENNDNIPDLLNEILYNLRWMLTMQDPHDGGVYHKCTNASFDGMVMPGVTKDPRFLVQKSTAAALNFSAVMAQASRVFSKYSGLLPGLSDSCITAAIASWDWALLQPEMYYKQSVINEKFKPQISTGEYGDRFLNDEWFWASAELLITTRNKKYESPLMKYKPELIQIPSWHGVAAMGYYSLLRQPTHDYVQQDFIASLKQQFISKADSLILNGGNKAFATIMGQSKSDYIWGSNSVAANQSIFLLNAWRINKRSEYLDGALSNLDYLIGRNATGYNFVTGMGTRYPKFPHHRPSVADGIDEPVPGLLAGGPNPGKQDKCNYSFHDPENCFADIDCSYATNEIAINWQAPLVYLAGALEVIFASRQQ